MDEDEEKPTEEETPTVESEESAPVADDASNDAFSEVLAGISALDAKIDALSADIAGFRETVAAMKVDSGAVVRDDADDEPIEVSDLPDPRIRDYTI